jgi:hypothetical protein
MAALRYIRLKLGSVSYYAHVTGDNREDNDDNDIINGDFIPALN